MYKGMHDPEDPDYAEKRLHLGLPYVDAEAALPTDVDQPNQ
jgi:hypothetical protein